MATIEKWAPIPGFVDYVVSNHGRVYSIKSDTYLRSRPSGWGYEQVVFYDKGRTHTKSIHRMVAEAFLGIPPVGYEANHKDGDKSNNSALNLEWTTKGQNNQHAIDIGLRKPRGTAVRIVETGEVFSTVKDCAKHINGFSTGISAVLNGKSPHYKRLHFEYA